MITSLYLGKNSGIVLSKQLKYSGGFAQIVFYFYKEPRKWLFVVLVLPAGIDPLFLILSAHKNAGRGSGLDRLPDAAFRRSIPDNKTENRHIFDALVFRFVLPAGIEPASPVPQTSILSIKLREHKRETTIATR